MDKNKLRFIRIIVALIIFVPTFIIHLFVEIDLFIILPITIVAYLIAGYDIVLRSLRNIIKGKLLDENFLMTLATIGAFVIGEYLEAVAVMIFYQIGEMFQEFAVEKSRRSIAGLMDIRPDTATIIKDGEEIVVDPEDVEVGDILIIKAGQKIPVDGIVIKGKTSLDTKALTGESIPRDISLGDEALSGSINIDGVIEIEATKIYFDSTVSKILDMVENAAGKKAKSEAFITKFARVYTPIVVILALLLGLIPPLFVGGWSDWIFRALTFLVVSCPCALVISVPLSFFCGIGGASKDGILVKGGSYLERLKMANVFIFDKTGTLTKGEFEVVEIKGYGYSEDDVLNLAASLESKSNHPIAVSIVKKANLKKNIDLEVEELAGYGLKAVGEDTILVGNDKLMSANNINYISHGGIGSVVYVAKNGVFVGSILVADTLKEDAKTTIEGLNSLGYKTIMLTGDHEDVALDTAARLGISEVKAELLPQNKVEVVEGIINNKSENDVIAFIGDGINDAPVLMRADVGISMGGIGSDSAIEASDVVLMYDNLSGILKAKKVAKKTISIVMQNIIFALIVKIGILVLSALGFANMWLAILGDVGVAVLAILNAMRCSKIK